MAGAKTVVATGGARMPRSRWSFARLRAYSRCAVCAAMLPPSLALALFLPLPRGRRINPSSCFPKLLLASLPRGGAGIMSGADLLSARSHLAKACFASLRRAQRPMLALPQTLPRGRGKKRALAGAPWCNMQALRDAAVEPCASRMDAGLGF